ncbi:MAG: hypothetical protein KBA50_08435 [Sedimentibacter sp.]|nr:hypothetical protein [Sedimentibacter sp.]
MKMIESSVVSMRELTIAKLYGTWLITGEGKHLQSRINSEPDVLFAFFLDRNKDFINNLK